MSELLGSQANAAKFRTESTIKEFFMDFREMSLAFKSKKHPCTQVKTNGTAAVPDRPTTKRKLFDIRHRIRVASAH